MFLQRTTEEIDWQGKIGIEKEVSISKEHKQIAHQSVKKIEILQKNRWSSRAILAKDLKAATCNNLIIKLEKT